MARLRRGTDEVGKNRIEAFNMADLQHAVLFRGQGNQFGGLRGVVRHRLFHEHMLALGEQLPGDLKMGDGGGDDVQGIAGGGGLGDGAEYAQFMFLRNLAGGFRVGVVYAGEFHLTGGGEFRIDAGMMLTERPGAEDGDFDL